MFLFVYVPTHKIFTTSLSYPANPPLAEDNEACVRMASLIDV